MSKEDVINKIKEILAKDKEFAGTEIKIKFNDKRKNKNEKRD